MVLPAIESQGPIEAWIIDDTGFPKKGEHSVGVARQYCGRLGKRENSQVAVSLSLANHHASLPVAWRLYLPKERAADLEHRRKAGVPDEIDFKTKPEIALEQVKAAGHADIVGIFPFDMLLSFEGMDDRSLEPLCERHELFVCVLTSRAAQQGHASFSI